MRRAADLHEVLAREHARAPLPGFASDGSAIWPTSPRVAQSTVTAMPASAARAITPHAEGLVVGVREGGDEARAGAHGRGSGPSAPSVDSASSAPAPAGT